MFYINQQLNDMKKVLYGFAMATAIAMASCGNTTQQTNADSDSTVTSQADADAQVCKEAIVAQVEKIYGRINEMNENGEIDLGQLEQEFCTLYYLNLKEHIAQYDANATGDMCFMGDEGYHWLLDLVPPFSVEQVSVDMLGPDRALVQVRLISTGVGKVADDEDEYTGGITMILCLEKGQWKVNNWLDPEAYDEGGYLGMLEAYIRENTVPGSEPETPVE